MYFPPLPHILLGRNVFNNPLHKLWDRSKNNKVIFSEKLVGFLKEVLKNFQILVKFSEKPFRGGLSLLHLLQPPGNIDHFFTPIEAGLGLGLKGKKRFVGLKGKKRFVHHHLGNTWSEPGLRQLVTVCSQLAPGGLKLAAGWNRPNRRLLPGTMVVIWVKSWKPGPPHNPCSMIP